MTIFKRGIEICFSPIGIMTILFLAGLILNFYRRSARIGRRLIWGGVWLYLIFLFTPLAEVLVANLERPFPPMLHPDASAGIRAIVVLSGYGEDISFLPVTSKLSEETMARVVEGIRLHRALPGTKLVVSGGVLRAGDRPVADVMADFIRAMGITNGDVVVEARSETTHENLVELQKMIGSGAFVLVTSAYNLQRSTAVARKLGMKPIAAPAAIWATQHYPAGMSLPEWGWRLIESMATPSTDRFGYLQRAYHEYLGYFWYWMLGRV